MAEFETARASITGSVVPTAGFSAGGGDTNEGGDTVEEQEGGGNTVTFGGVETFAATNSTSGSTPGGNLTEGMFSVLIKRVQKR